MTYTEFIKYVEEHTDRVFVMNITHLFENQPSLKGFIEYSDFTTAPASTKYHGSYIVSEFGRNSEYYKQNVEFEYNNETLLKGHGDKSVMMLASLIQLTEEEVACIRYHMSAFTDKEEWNDYTRAIHKYPNVLWTHHADMIATHIMEVKNE